MNQVSLIRTIVSAAGLENNVAVKTLLALGTAMTTYLYGGWHIALEVLGYAMFIDYTSGLAAAYFEKKLSSKVGAKGFVKKLLAWCMIGLAHKLDLLLGTNILMVGTAWFYVANEGLSFTENAARLGLPMPKKLRDALIQVRQEAGPQYDDTTAEHSAVSSDQPVRKS